MMATPRGTCAPPCWSGHSQHPIEIIDKAIAIGAQERHAGGRIAQARLQFAALLTRFGKSGGERDRTAGTRRAKLGRHIDAGVAIDTDEGGIRRGRQIGEPR